MAESEPQKLPTLGAALTIAELERLHNWVLEAGRDLELQEFCYAAVLNADWKPLADRYKGLLDGHRGRVGIHGPFWGFDIATQDPDIQKIVRRRLMQGLDVCEHLGATHMVIHSPYTAWDYNNADNFGERDVVLQRCRRMLRDAVKRAEDIGCEIVIENVQDKDPHARVELVKALDSPAARVSLDTGHAFYAHGSTGGPPVDYFVIAAGKLLTHVHLQDADGYADRHWAPGEGTIRWRPVFEAIAKHCDMPRLILELKDKDRLIPATEYLAALGLAR